MSGILAAAEITEEPSGNYRRVAAMSLILRRRGAEMKIENRADGSFERRLSRREFVGQGAAAAMAFSIVPRHVLGGSGFVPPSDKVNMAFIGVGSQGLRVMLYFLKEP